MLFDLRGRKRRRAIQVIYGSLAILMAGGLVLFGVGTGGGGGGLLNAFNPNSGTSAGKAYVSQQTKNAEKQTRLDPSSAKAWANLVNARYLDASQGFDSTTQAYTSVGKADLRAAGQAYQQYLKLVKVPDANVARLMGEGYSSLGEFNQAAQAWQEVANSSPNVSSYWTYVAVNAYEAKNVSLGDLAGGKAIALTPKAQRATLTSELNSVKVKANPSATTTPATTTTAPSVTTTVPATKAKTTKGKSIKKKK